MLSHDSSLFSRSHFLSLELTLVFVAATFLSLELVMCCVFVRWFDVCFDCAFGFEGLSVPEREASGL
ncbi:hypothetical protein Lal_00032655 [Lupinus albus]|nr:hypothetical protein Lal_00032655 [Lupinus albus]